MERTHIAQRGPPGTLPPARPPPVKDVGPGRVETPSSLPPPPDAPTSVAAESSDDDPTLVDAMARSRPSAMPPEGGVSRSARPASVVPALGDEVPDTVRKIVEQSTLPLGKALRELQRRLDAIEHRSPASAQAAPSKIAEAAAPWSVVAQAPRMPAPWSVVAHAPQIPEPPPFGRSPGWTTDIGAMDRATSLDPDMRALDGRHRRRRALFALYFVLIVVFGGLFTALAASYSNGSR